MRHSRWIVVGWLCTLCACKDSPARAHLLNGFDFPVVVKIDAQGEIETIEIPPNGRVTPDVEGEVGVEATTTDGAVLQQTRVDFGKKDSKCVQVYNVLGAAPVVQEDLRYGTGFGTPGYEVHAGSTWSSHQYCAVSWVFEDPPESVTVKSGSPDGRTLTWVHVDGDWATSVESLLADDGQFKGQSRGAAQSLVAAVSKHDPNNPQLGDLRAKFDAAKLAWPKAR